MADQPAGEIRTFVIEEYEKKTSRNGNPYGRVKMKPGGWASTWSEHDRKFAYEHVGDRVSAYVDDSGEYTNLAELSEPVGGGGGYQPGLEGAAKDASIVRQVAWKCVSRIMAGAQGTPTEDASAYTFPWTATATFSETFEEMKELAHWIELDILRGGDEGPEPPAGSSAAQDDDIPF